MVCLAAFTAAYLLGDMFDRFDDLIRYGGLGLLGLEYFALKLPLIVSQVMPVACLAGVLLGFALLNRIGRSARMPATRHQPARDGGAGVAGRGADFGF